MLITGLSFCRRKRNARRLPFCSTAEKCCCFKSCSRMKSVFLLKPTFFLTWVCLLPFEGSASELYEIEHGLKSGACTIAYRKRADVASYHTICFFFGPVTLRTTALLWFCRNLCGNMTGDWKKASRVVLPNKTFESTLWGRHAGAIR